MSTTTNLGRYRYISALGSGGMSTVVLAEDTLLGRRVALKRLHSGEDARRVSRLRREALIGASVSHQNLVPIYDIVTAEGGDSVIVMEYVEGETLRDAVKREGALPIPLVLRILDGVAAALDAIHAQGIVHRDVKPANILLGRDGSIKLADLGVASAPDRTRITTTGGIVGTFSYMAPEQLGGAQSTAAADIYALAAVAFEALSGRKARIEPNPLALAHAIATGPPPDLRQAWPEAPAAAAKLLVRGMSRNPKDRPKSAGELVARLREALAPAVTAPAGPAVAKPRRRRARAAPVAAAAASPAPAAASPAPAAASRAPAKAAPAPAAASGAPAEASPAPAAPKPDPPAPEKPAPAADKAAPTRHNRRLRAAAALIPLLVLAAVMAAIVASSGSNPSSHRSAGSTATAGAGTSTHASTTRSHPATTSHTTSVSRTTAQSSSAVGAATPPAASSASAGAGAPVSAVERFYTLAAGHDYSAAWALTDAAFQRQLGGYRSFENTMSASRSITFDSARTLSQSAGAATVAIRTTSFRTDRTQHCAGTVQLVPGGGGSWLLHQIAIGCS